MLISVAEAEGRLTELLGLAKQGEDIVLTEDGHPFARLQLVDGLSGSSSEADTVVTQLSKPLTLMSDTGPVDLKERMRVLREIRDSAAQRPSTNWPDAAHSQDFLYDELGLPK
jgi:antitoxin (DNA-binding transcriptional repressor) of toxin-antitoxin stability system